MRVTARPSHPLGALKETDNYIERPADADLLRSLQAGEPAYVLAARQTGKTYLLRRTQSKLMAQGYARFLLRRHHRAVPREPAKSRARCTERLWRRGPR